jgi:hypothetical protein
MHGKAVDQKCTLLIGLEKIRVMTEVKRGEDVVISLFGIYIRLIET